MRPAHMFLRSSILNLDWILSGRQIRCRKVRLKDRSLPQKHHYCLHSNFKFVKLLAVLIHQKCHQIGLEFEVMSLIGLWVILDVFARVLSFQLIINVLRNSYLPSFRHF